MKSTEKTKTKSASSLVQARVRTSTKKKLQRIANAAGRLKLATYIAFLLEEHVRQINPTVLKAITKAWHGVPEDARSVVSRKDGPK